MAHRNIHAGLSFLLTLLITNASSFAGPMEAGPGEWPLIRHDAQNTGASPLQGNMKSAPEIIATYPLGGRPWDWYLPADLDGDGMDEIISTAGGAIRAIKGNGTVLWKTIIPRGAALILGTPDLNGDGKLEVVSSTSIPATIHLLSGQTGEILWEKSYDEQVGFANGTRFADLDGDGVTDMFILGYAPAINSHQLGWASSFKKDLTKPERIWGPLDVPFNAHYRPQTIITDLDGDSDNDIVISSAIHWDHGLMVTAFDAKTGVVRRMVFYPNGNRNYGHLQAIKTKGKPQQDVLAIGMLGEAHITYLVNDATKLVEGWHVNETFQIPYNPVIDQDGDGRYEIVYTRYIGDGEKPTKDSVTLMVRDLATGKVIREFQGLRLQGFVQGDGLAHPFIIATTVPENTIVLISELNRQKPLPIANATPCMVTRMTPLHIMNEPVLNRSGYEVFTEDVDSDGIPEFFISTSNAILGIDPLTLKSKFRYPCKPNHDIHVLGANHFLSSKSNSLLFTAENGYQIVSLAGKLLQQIPIYNSYPLVNIAGSFTPKDPMTVFVTRSDGIVAALDGVQLCKGKSHELWTKRGMNGFQAPSLLDLDLDGKREVMLCDMKTSDPVAFNAKGKVVKRFPALPSDGSALISGTFVAACSGSSIIAGAVSCVGPNKGIRIWTAWDDRNGKMLWQHKKGSYPRMTPCVYDINGDGVEDYAWSHGFDIIAVDGRNGKDFWGTYDTNPGYHIVTIADMDGSGKPSLLLSGGYMALYGYNLKGEKIWKTPDFDYNAGSAAALADVDGDGSLEFGTAFSDRFACYNAADGSLQWKIPMPGPGSDVVSADVNGDDRGDFVFGCTDGLLYAVGDAGDGASGRILWTVSLGAPAGPPSIADLDGDGGLEIMVSTTDGRMCVLAAGKAE